VGLLKLLEILTDKSYPESFPVWLAIIISIISVVGGMLVAIFLANRIAAKFISKENMIKIINKNILPFSPFYDLILRNIDRIYKKKDL
jgi:uncharacterized membrane protein YphA (DoxX/SURF4 family)